MRSRYFLFIALLGFAFTTSAFANNEPLRNKRVAVVLDDYMDSYLSSDYKKLKGILDADAQIKHNRNQEVYKYGANVLLNAVKEMKGCKQQECTANYIVLSESDAIIVAEVAIHYANFNGDQKHTLFIEQQKNGGWKITSIYKNYLPRYANLIDTWP